MKGAGGKQKAHIVAVNMGYGHERPAHVMRQLFGYKNTVTIANNYEGIPERDKRLWEDGRKAYERVSRFKKVPIFGRAVFGLMNELQRIPPFYPRRDLSSPSLQVRQFYWLIRQRGMMRHLIEKLSENPLPLICTFMSPAFAAEEFGYQGEIFVLCTDSDISRAWVPLDPKRTRIRYFAPTGRVAERLKLYGVPEKNIELTGFPLPAKNIGGPSSKAVLTDLKRRICNLDPNGYFVQHTGVALTAYLGAQYCSAIKKKKVKPIELAYAVGGAGAQKEIGATILKSLHREIKQGKISLHLIAGTRKEVNTYYIDAIKSHRLSKYIGKGISVVYKKSRQEYFDTFSDLMRKIDILWTKPSELSFYAGLGIPIIMAPTVGSQEDFNKQWLFQTGAGFEQMNPKYTNEWLFDWIESGALARMAWNGYIEAPTHGVHRIHDIIAGRGNTIHTLPLIV